VYGSITQNRGLKVGQKDDMESAIYCVFRLFLKSLGIDELPWVPSDKKMNVMIQMKAEKLTKEHIFSFIKSKADLSEDVEKKKVLISVMTLVRCL
jgi:hypothetical protein